MKEGRNNGNAILVRTSERQSFLTCRQKWYWSYVERLRSPTTDPKLLFGDLVHQSLALYYKPGRKRGPHPARTFERLSEKLADETAISLWADDEILDFTELGVGMLERYVEHWIEQDKEFRILSSEQTFQLPIGRLNGKRVWYVGTIDGVWEHMPSTKIRFLETKTTTAISDSALPMDEQVGAYWTYGPRWLRNKGILKSGERLDGILYNWLRKALPSEGDYDEQGRKLNKNGEVSKRQPAPFFARNNTFRGDFEAERVKQRVWQEVKDMEAARGNPELVYKNPGPSFFPNCKFCSFRDMCELHETGNDWVSMLKSETQVWDPYAEHEVYDGR